MIMGVAADIAGAARSGADIVQRLFHRGDHLGMMSHGEIIVGAPDGDRSRASVAGKAARIGICALVAKYVDEHPVAAFGMKAADRVIENPCVVHWRTSSRAFRAFNAIPAHIPARTARNSRPPKAGAPHLAATSKIVDRSEEHTSELQSLMRISYAVFCFKQKNTTIHYIIY